jgi:hypothetical protein
MRRPQPHVVSNPTSVPSGVVDVEPEVRTVLSELEGLAARHFVALRIASQPGVTARAEPDAFRDALTDVIDGAIRSTPGGCVLITNRRLGGWSEVTVSDDGPVLDHATHAVQLRHAQESATLRGWLFSINARPGYGTSVSIRLPGGNSAIARPADAADEAQEELAQAAS